jgi:hypothetical protein
VAVGQLQKRDAQGPARPGLQSQTRQPSGTCAHQMSACWSYPLDCSITSGAILRLQVQPRSSQLWRK